MKAYFASGFGFSESTKTHLYNDCLPQLQGVPLEVINPWDLTTDAEVRQAVENGTPAALAALRLLIGSRNAAAIRVSDILVANLDGQEVDSGVAWEMGLAFGLGKPVFAWRSDFRASGELGGKVNLQVAFGIRGDIEPSLSALVARLKRELPTLGLG
jgi:hypothetical protein